jgi:hypothetical protein
MNRGGEGERGARLDGGGGGHDGVNDGGLIPVGERRSQLLEGDGDGGGLIGGEGDARSLALSLSREEGEPSK